MFHILPLLQCQRMVIWLASGYFNMLNEYAQLIAKRGTYHVKLVSASPQVRYHRAVERNLIRPIAG